VEAIELTGTVDDKHRLILDEPFLNIHPGRVRVIILEGDKCVAEKDDLLQAAQSSLGFWDNAYDDEDWNDA